jgi:hypothetical protein
MGDLAYHPCGVLIIPLHGDEVESGMLVVNPADLGGLGWTDFQGRGYHNASFCAVDNEGYVYFPGVGYEEIVQHSLNCSNWQFAWTPTRTWTLLDETGAPVARHHKQGAVFSPDDRLFVMSTGYGWENSDPVLDGIHVFDTMQPEPDTWRRVAHSSNGSGLFNFMWDPDFQEPEGMTWLDLDGGSVEGMWGQLHILLLDNIYPDTIYFKHYSSRIYVNWAYPFSGQGTVYSPYRTVSQAAGLAWDGCEIWIQGGSYDEAVRFDRRIRIVPVGGTVRIGD